MARIDITIFISVLVNVLRCQLKFHCLENADQYDFLNSRVTAGFGDEVVCKRPLLGFSRGPLWP